MTHDEALLASHCNAAVLWIGGHWILSKPREWDVRAETVKDDREFWLIDPVTATAGWPDMKSVEFVLTADRWEPVPTP